MKYCGVKHGRNSKVYYFRIPPEYVGRVKIGSRVMCDTSIGNEIGKVVAITEAGGDGILKKTIDSDKPIREIIGVCGDSVDIDNIKIPSRFLAVNPSPSKLIRRVSEYKKYGGFTTSIVIASDGTLRDGYTAYLTAKFLGLKKLQPCYVLSDNKGCVTVDYEEA